MFDFFLLVSPPVQFTLLLDREKKIQCGIWITNKGNSQKNTIYNKNFSILIKGMKQTKMFNQKIKKIIDRVSCFIQKFDFLPFSGIFFSFGMLLFFFSQCNFFIILNENKKKNISRWNVHCSVYVVMVVNIKKGTIVVKNFLFRVFRKKNRVTFQLWNFYWHEIFE